MQTESWISYQADKGVPGSREGSRGKVCRLASLSIVVDERSSPGAAFWEVAGGAGARARAGSIL